MDCPDPNPARDGRMSRRRTGWSTTAARARQRERDGSYWATKSRPKRFEVDSVVVSDAGVNVVEAALGVKV